MSKNVTTFFMKNSANNISVVIAAYNGEHYIAQQLDSLCQQSVQPYEVIIQDDASSDRTVELIRSFDDRLPIKLFVNRENTGYIENFESAIKKATGDYIALSDQDDVWDPLKLETLLHGIGGNTLAYSDSHLIDQDGNELGQTLSSKLKNRFISAHSPLPFIYDNCVSAHAMLFRHELTGHLFPFPRHLYFDAWIASSAAAQNGIIYIDKALVGYRQHTANTLSRQKKERLPFFQKIRQKTAKKTEEHQTRSAIIDDLLKSSLLDTADRDVLLKLKQGHDSFALHWFNFPFFLILLRCRKQLFAITQQNSLTLCLKKAIGLKLYKVLPFL